MSIKVFEQRGGAVVALSFAFALSSTGPSLGADPEEQAVTRDLNMQQLETPGVIYGNAQEPAGPVADELIPLEDAEFTSDELLDRAVETSEGEPVGRVRNVAFDDAGRAISADVELEGDDRVVVIGAEALSYDQDGDILIAEMSISEVQELPEI
ncbi:MAG: PRC-barrel domain-containing protein [Alphaproteobacteria bacterium]